MLPQRYRRISDREKTRIPKHAILPLPGICYAAISKTGVFFTVSFGGDYWTRTSNLLRAKMRQVRKERAIPSFPHLLAQNHLLSAPLFPLFPACSDSSLGHGLGQSMSEWTLLDKRTLARHEWLCHNGNNKSTQSVYRRLP